MYDIERRKEILRAWFAGFASLDGFVGCLVGPSEARDIVREMTLEKLKGVVPENTRMRQEVKLTVGACPAWCGFSIVVTRMTLFIVDGNKWRESIIVNASKQYGYYDRHCFQSRISSHTVNGQRTINDGAFYGEDIQYTVERIVNSINEEIYHMLYGVHSWQNGIEHSVWLVHRSVSNKRY